MDFPSLLNVAQWLKGRYFAPLDRGVYKARAPEEKEGELMELVQRLYEHSYEKASATKVACLTIGLRYTAVLTDDGGMGIAYTHFKDAACCSMNWDCRDYEGESATELLKEIKHSDPLHCSMGMALINALNYHYACGLPEDPANRILTDALGIAPETRIAMVGFFRPLVKIFRERGAMVEVLDDMQGLGERGSFYGKLDGWADVLLVTSSSILNHTAEEILGHVSPDVRVALVGPSTPMIADAFLHLPVHMLAGAVPVDKEGVMKAVRHGAGTPVIQQFTRKVHLALPKFSSLALVGPAR